MRVSMAALRVFLEVAEAGSVSVAAERLGRTPSAVSMTLKQLEQEIGAPLFEAERKNRLSKVGAFTLARARDLLGHYDRTLASVHAFARNASGRIDVACVPSVAMTILPEVISQFRYRFPDVHIEAYDADSPTVIEAVEAGKVEMGVASLRSDRPTIRFERLFEEPLGLVCRSDDPLCRETKPVTWKTVETRTFIGNGITGAIDSADFRSIVTGAPIILYNVLSLIALVRAGLGVTVLPRLSIAGAPDDIAFVPVADRKATRVVGVAMRTGEKPSPAASAFLGMMKACLTAKAAAFGIVERAST